MTKLKTMQTVKNATDVDGVRSDAVSLIQEMHRGNLAYELSAAMDRVLDGVKETGKKGSVTLKIEVEPMSKLGENAIAVTPDISEKVPKLKMKAESRFIGRNGEISKDDPDQPTLPGGRDWGDDDESEIDVNNGND